ncbi:hypothetical protein [Shinella sp. NM-101]|uniref:hypothetical protein n=1 Tax=Shinella sp. NM-101 TaxID=2744455 RepID=UPI001F166DB3|nr:hypothetical protein [Shinella sp. NM-101]
MADLLWMTGPETDKPQGLFRATKKAGAKTHRPSSSSSYHQCQYIRGQEQQAMTAIASGRKLPALISNADGRDIGGHCVQNKGNAENRKPRRRTRR